MVLTYTFPACWLHVDEEGRFLHTAFPDGTVLESVPDLDKDGPTARAYGYGDDIRRLWREHDLLHHLVGTLFGHGLSPTIWSVAHENHPDALPRWIQLGEEEFVGHIHRWLNLDERHPALGCLDDLGWSRDELREIMLAFLRGEICDARPFAPKVESESGEIASREPPPAPPPKGGETSAATSEA
ncbi:MAG TPA: hypothetical protein VF627_00050 [Abditibacterium sp.]|jgi:hypothetical protein